MYKTTLLLVLLHNLHLPSNADDVIWLPNKSIKLPQNFKDGQLPCSGQNIIFPDSVEEGVLISGLSISGLILPIDGEIVLEEEGILFGADPKDNCTKTGYTTYIDDALGSWAQPDAWSTPRFNKATPDAERVPCYDDNVIFPNGSQFTIQLPDRPQKVRLLLINGHATSGTEIEDNINSLTSDQSQQFILSLPGMLKTGLDDRPFGCPSTLHDCPCQEYELDINCELKYCPPPKCSYPIKPIGHCCELCGASMVINVTKDFNTKSFKKSVKDLIDSYGDDKFEYHVGLLPQPYIGAVQPERVQVVVMDKGEYTGVCKEVITEINYMMSKDYVKGHVLLLSGNPSSQSGTGGKIVGFVFFIVVLGMGGLFAYYYRSSMLNLTDIRGGMTRGMISRLRQRTESVISLARRDSTVSTATTTGTAFRNPMYSSMRERVQVVAPDAEE